MFPKRLFLLLCVVVFIGMGLGVNQASAVHVNGYYRSNGTYVNGYERTAPDGNPYNNYSYPGNYNPNTGKITGGNPATYLNNYYSNSGGGSYYSYPSTPTCPANSYSNGTGSCTCNFGYVSSGGGCVSGNSLCYSQLGYSSSFDSLSNNCKCNYGYVIGANGQCTNASLYCSSKIGLMSQYNSLTKQCECMTGYVFNGSSCVYQTPSYQYYSSPKINTPSTCPINSTISSTDSTKCQCNAGFQANTAKDGCVATPTLTNTRACQAKYGLNSNWDGTLASNGYLNCGCQSNYTWNKDKTLCIAAL